MSWRGWLTFVILCVIWGFPYFLIKLALLELTPVCIAWSRIALGAAILVPVAVKRGVLRPAFGHMKAVFVFALAELVVPFSLIALGEQWISSSLAGILIATVPLMVILLAPLFGVRERITATRLLGLAVGFLGVVAIVGFDTGHGTNLWAGLVCMLVAAAGYAIGPLVVERHLAEVDELGALTASLVVATVVLLPFALAGAPAQVPSPASLASVVVLGVVCTALGLLLYFYLIVEAGAARASVVAYVNPAVAALLGVLLLHEPFGLAAAIGFAMILVGSWLATLQPQQTTRAAA